jgi:MFS family permease
VSSAGSIGRSAADALAASSQSDVLSASPGQGHPRKWLILVAVSLAMMLGIFNIALVNIAIPALVRDLGSTVDRVSWVLNAFNIAQAVLLLSFGRLADRFGARRVFLTSICTFTVFSMACGLSQNVQQLIAFRILQGIHVVLPGRRHLHVAESSACLHVGAPVGRPVSRRGL